MLFDILHMASILRLSEPPPDIFPTSAGIGEANDRWHGTNFFYYYYYYSLKAVAYVWKKYCVTSKWTTRSWLLLTPHPPREIFFRIGFCLFWNFNNSFLIWIHHIHLRPSTADPHNLCQSTLIIHKLVFAGCRYCFQALVTWLYWTPFKRNLS